MGPALAALAVAVVAAVAAWLTDRRRRSYADLPTSPAAAVFAGRNEVKGRAWAADPLTSHTEHVPSVWWDYCLEEEREHTRTVTSTDSEGKSRTRTERYKEWHSIDTKSAALDTFEVVDDTGSVPVRLAEANVVPREVLQRVFHEDDDTHGLLANLAELFDNKTGRYRETERAVVVGDELFVVGEAVLDEASCVPVLGGNVLVSTRSESSHVSWLVFAVIGLIVVAVGAATAASGLLIDPDEPASPAAWLPGLALAGVLLLLGWGVTIHNRLRLVSTGVDRAWSLIDVQLQRRYDLIPALVAVVAGYAAHEREVLQSVTGARWAAGNATAPAELSGQAAEQTAGLTKLLAVAEQYPELKADEGFVRLQGELADCENRIAASRTFYNDTLTLLRDRARSFPGVLVARRLPLTHRELIGAEGFERTVPAIERAFA
jgi:LemA protein